MSEQEFESYISLISKLLRLNARQRAEIGEELRDHMELRLADLIAAGYSREEALRMAIEEFGDAAGLANEFVSISHSKRRRWMMRFATFSVAACFVFTVMIVSMWPEQSRLNFTERSTAQDGDPFGESPQEKKTADPFSSGKGNNDNPFGDPNSADLSPFNAAKRKPIAKTNSKKIGATTTTLNHQEEIKKIRSELMQATKNAELTMMKRIHADFVDTPLSEVVEELSEQAGIPIHFSQVFTMEQGDVVDQQVTFSSSTTSLGTLLTMILKVNGCCYYLKEGNVVITSEDDPAAFSTVKVYNCRDLVSMAAKGKLPKKTAQAESLGDTVFVQFGGGGGGSSSDNPDSESYLTEMLELMVEPDSWTSVGGLGEISSHNGLIAIRSSANVHRKVEDFLEILRLADEQQK